MEKKLSITYIILIVLTLLALPLNFKGLFAIIMLIAILKFWLVSFKFMQLSSANTFWKVLLVCFTLIFGGIILLIRY